MLHAKYQAFLLLWTHLLYIDFFTLVQLHNCNCNVVALIDLYLVLKSVDKVLESLRYRKVMATMDSHLYYKMAAYRKQHFFETTLIRLVED